MKGGQDLLLAGGGFEEEEGEVLKKKCTKNSAVDTNQFGKVYISNHIIKTATYGGVNDTALFFHMVG